MVRLRLSFLILLAGTGVATAQVQQIQPQILSRDESDRKVTAVEVAPRFVTTIRLPETVSSVVVGDAASFLVEHSEREPKLVFVKALTTKPAETNLLIATSSGRQVSLSLVNRGESPAPEGRHVAFLVKYGPTAGFLVEPAVFPSSLIGQTVSLQGSPGPSKPSAVSAKSAADVGTSSPRTSLLRPDTSAPGVIRETSGLDELLQQQERAALPRLYGEHISQDSEQGDLVRAGVSKVIDRGQEVVVLFSVVNSSKHSILLMPPQVQLGGRLHNRWSTAEQMPVTDFRLNQRRLGPGERADGVVLFQRPPYKQSTETLLLQIAESGAVDRPALVPIGFGISTVPED
jgi:hypothetical protein